MMVRFMRGLGRLVIGHPGLVAGVALALTVFLYANIHNLRTGTELTDMFGRDDPQWRAASQIGKELGYGNQLFVLVQAPRGDADTSEAMEAAADRRDGRQRTLQAGSQRTPGRGTAQPGPAFFLALSFLCFARPEQSAG
jgi:uncharacterized membrane protein YdfJ with MMPL/SSD domain